MPMPLRVRFLLLLPLLTPWYLGCQPNFTANNGVPAWNSGFDYGVNPGNYPPVYTDTALANLAHGVPGQQDGFGITALRPGLFHDVLEAEGFESRLPFFQYYQYIGLRNTVAILGFPPEKERELAYYCNGEQSQLYRNLYEPVWDEGQNGTLINENNPFALYVWKTATLYKGLVRVYEIWNEPDFDGGQHGWKKPGMDGNWWDAPPAPCATALKAPVYFYIRCLRIAYEVIKSVDPNAYVAVGGLGYPSFLDAVCRYTDNPFDGTVTEVYPNKGGAYFDCMSFHAYPHLDASMKTWDAANQSYRYNRHSDAALNAFWRTQEAFNRVLDLYGYNSQEFPEKMWICSEFNLPRKPFEDYIGSEQAQVNFVVKSFVTAQMNQVRQLHLYSLADALPEKAAVSEFDFMGMFKNLKNKAAGAASPNALAYAVKTTHDLLENATFHPEETARLQLPENIRGGAFRLPNSQFVYVLWLESNADKDESEEADFSFPPEINLRYLEQRYWHYSKTGARHTVLARQVKLSPTPSFFTQAFITNNYPKSPKVTPNPVAEGVCVLSFWVFEDSPVTIELYDANGRLVQQLLKNENLIEGPHARLLDLNSLASGVYMARIVTRESDLSVRIVKL
jgi:hypothetical protein